MLVRSSYMKQKKERCPYKFKKKSISYSMNFRDYLTYDGIQVNQCTEVIISDQE